MVTDLAHYRRRKVAKMRQRALARKLGVSELLIKALAEQVAHDERQRIDEHKRRLEQATGLMWR